MEIINENYKTLKIALDAAFNRAAKGKGADRHANGRPFDQQPILSIQRDLGSTQFALGQIMKKTTELTKFNDDDAKKELLDIMVYAAAAWVYLDQREKQLEFTMTPPDHRDIGICSAPAVAHNRYGELV